MVNSLRSRKTGAPHLKVYISSTFGDLKDERGAISSALIKINCEAISFENYDVLQNNNNNPLYKSIDEADVFVIILGIRYGYTVKTTSEEIISTEKEYNYAIKCNKPILAFIRNDSHTDLNTNSVIGVNDINRLENLKSLTRNYSVSDDWIEVSDLLKKFIGAIQKKALDAQNKSPKNQRRSKDGPASRTKIGRAVVNNYNEIATLALSLRFLIDARLDLFVSERPNSKERKTAIYIETNQLIDLRRHLIEFLDKSTSYKANLTKEMEVISATNAFSAGVQDWWKTSHQEICTKSLDTALFLSAIGVCSLAGAGGAMSVAISGALIGGKPVLTALKALSKKNTKIGS